MSFSNCIRITFTAENDLLLFQMQTGFLNHLFDRFPDFPADCWGAFCEEACSALWHDVSDISAAKSSTSPHRLLVLYHSGFISAYLVAPKSEGITLLRILKSHETEWPAGKGIFPKDRLSALDF